MVEEHYFLTSFEFFFFFKKITLLNLSSSLIFQQHFGGNFTRATCVSGVWLTECLQKLVNRLIDILQRISSDISLFIGMLGRTMAWSVYWKIWFPLLTHARLWKRNRCFVSDCHVQLSISLTTELSSTKQTRQTSSKWYLAIFKF